MAASAEPITADIDPVALRAKYRAERDKRLRADGNQQYVEMTGDADTASGNQVFQTSGIFVP